MYQPLSHHSESPQVSALHHLRYNHKLGFPLVARTNRVKQREKMFDQEITSDIWNHAVFHCCRSHRGVKGQATFFFLLQKVIETKAEEKEEEEVNPVTGKTGAEVQDSRWLEQNEKVNWAIIQL